MPEQIADKIFLHRTPGGLTVLLEPLDHVVSTALVLAAPLGAGRDAEAAAGAAGVISEWMFRGAGGRSSREISGRLDYLGCHRDETVRSEAMYLSSCQAEHALDETLGLYVNLLSRTTYDEATFAPCVELARQELEGLADQPSRMCSLGLREQFFPTPLGASPYGTAEGLAALTPDLCRRHGRRLTGAPDCILAVAGRFEVDRLAGRIDELSAHWAGEAAGPVEIGAAPRGVSFIEKASAQVQIGLAWDAPGPTDEAYYPCRVAEMVLSGGMGSRLFTEVREKRGLVYSVSASYRANSRAAGLFVYAGTSPDRAQQTLEVTAAELDRLAEGVSEDELAIARTQLKSALVMQSERTMSRGFALANDWLRIGRVRTLEEIAERIDRVSLDQVNGYLAARPPGDYTAVVVGPGPLDTACIE